MDKKKNNNPDDIIITLLVTLNVYYIVKNVNHQCSQIKIPILSV